MSQALQDHQNKLLELANATFSDSALRGGKLQGRPSRRFGTPSLVRRGLMEVASVPFCAPFNIPIQAKRNQLFQENAYNLTDPTDSKAFQDLLKEAYNPGPQQAEAWSEIAAYRSFVLSMSFPAQPFALSAFQTVDLAMDELVMMEFPASPNANGFTVRSAALPGMPIIANWTAKSTVEYLDMEMISTDRVQYRLYDLQLGEVSEAERINARLQLDLDLKIDSMAMTQIDNSIMDSGLRETIDLHPSINVNNIPDVNHLDLDAAFPGAPKRLTLPKLKAILAHLVLLNSLGAERAVTPTAWVMSPQHITDSWEFVDLVSGYEASAGSNPLIEDPRNTVPVDVRGEIFQSGMMTTAWGFNINWQPNSQLDRGRIYIFMNQPLGWLFTKSSMDRSYTFDDTNSHKHAIDNYGEMWIKKALRYFVPDLWKYRILVVDL